MREKNQAKMLLFTSEENARDTIEKIYGKEYRDFRIVQIVLENESNKDEAVNGIPVLCGRDKAVEYALSNVVDEVVRLDTEYIENWSLGLDISLILKTFVVVFKGSGSK